MAEPNEWSRWSDDRLQRWIDIARRRGLHYAGAEVELRRRQAERQMQDVELATASEQLTQLRARPSVHAADQAAIQARFDVGREDSLRKEAESLRRFDLTRSDKQASEAAKERRAGDASKALAEYRERQYDLEQAKFKFQQGRATRADLDRAETEARLSEKNARMGAKYWDDQLYAIDEEERTSGDLGNLEKLPPDSPQRSAIVERVNQRAARLAIAQRERNRYETLFSGLGGQRGGGNGSSLASPQAAALDDPTGGMAAVAGDMPAVDYEQRLAMRAAGRALPAASQPASAASDVATIPRGQPGDPRIAELQQLARMGSSTAQGALRSMGLTW